MSQKSNEFAKLQTKLMAGTGNVAQDVVAPHTLTPGERLQLDAFYQQIDAAKERQAQGAAFEAYDRELIAESVREQDQELSASADFQDPGTQDAEATEDPVFGTPAASEYAGASAEFDPDSMTDADFLNPTESGTLLHPDISVPGPAGPDPFAVPTAADGTGAIEPAVSRLPQPLRAVAPSTMEVGPPKTASTLDVTFADDGVAQTWDADHATPMVAELNYPAGEPLLVERLTDGTLRVMDPLGNNEPDDDADVDLSDLYD